MGLLALRQWPGRCRPRSGWRSWPRAWRRCSPVSARASVAQWYDKAILAGPLAQFLIQAALAALLFAEAARRLARAADAAGPGGALGRAMPVPRHVLARPADVRAGVPRPAC